MSEQTKALVPVLEPVFVEVMDNRPKLIEISQGQVNPQRLWNHFELSTFTMPKLRECANTPEGKASVISGLIKCADLQLVPNTLNLAWMLPFVDHEDECKKNYHRNCKCPKVLAQFMPGYKGYEQCERQSDELIYKFRSQAVYRYERDKGFFKFIDGGENIHHERCLDDDFKPADEDIILVYSKIYRTDGNFYLHFQTREEFLKSARRTKSIRHYKKGESPAKEAQGKWYTFQDDWKNWKEIVGAWRTDFIPMALKTNIRAQAVRDMQLTPISKIGKAVQYDEEGQENPMRLNFNGTMPELPAPVSRTEKIVRRERAKVTVITTPERELHSAPVAENETQTSEKVDNAPDVPDAESKAGKTPAEAVPSSAENAKAPASPAPASKTASGAGENGSFLDWQTIAYDLGKGKLFDARFKALLAEERVKSMDNLSGDKQKEVVSKLRKIVQGWVAEKEKK